MLAESVQHKQHCIQVTTRGNHVDLAGDLVRDDAHLDTEPIFSGLGFVERANWRRSLIIALSAGRSHDDRLPLKGVPPPQHLKSSLHQDLNVEPKSPVIDVPKVHLDAASNLLDRWCRTSQSVHLGPTGYSRLYVMTKSVIL